MPLCELLLDLVTQIQDFPRHVGIHPGGFLLGSVPVHDLVPIENATMEGRTVLQWDKYDVEDMNLFKVDLLGLGALTLLDKAFGLIADHRGPQWDMASLPPDDPATYDMICAGDTIGVFQIESRAQMAMLPRLRPRHFYDLVIEVSIVRPGPIAGDMVHPYLRRRNGEEPIVYPHPSLEPVLSRTLGVPLFQEQVMKLAMVAGGYTPGEADQLRRDMAAWRSSGRIERHRERLISRMREKGVSQEFAERVFEQIRGFGEYGFPESHAASFALIAYATAWLRCHHPVEFTCGILNSQPMGFYSVATLVDDAKRHGVSCLPIDVNHSDWDCVLEWMSGDPTREGGGDFAVRMGMRFLKGARESEWSRIDAARRQGGAFVDVEGFARRTRVNETSISRLAQAGAFESCVMTQGRRGHLWRVHGAVACREDTLVLAETEGTPPFADLGDFDTVAWDYQVGGHSVRGHPMESFRAELTRRGLHSAEAVRRLPNDKWINAVGLVITRQRPGTASGVLFMTLEDETGFMNLVVWPKVFERFSVLIKTTTCIGVSGRVQSKNGVVHIIAASFWKPRFGPTQVQTASRDFR
jgi:error-prone DNA polymerase